MATGSASVIINRAPAEVFAVVADITRTGEWSPECMSGRWVDGASGPAVGAKFEGDNKVVIAGIPMKKWTTTSEVTAYAPGEVFEFVAEGFTTWRYELEPTGAGTKLTESFSFDASTGMQGFIYEKLLRRSRSMVKGIQATLTNIKAVLES